ncbi:hypothetical protein ZIOFF_033856 [Zingiber officinale]|uniref:DYW domain-containing protein n=1 Tax=Zingiber officinale TaxID=94328 RepID=A0A8J5GKB2_ZINOF|nr:hypothetical protein ZIOFF_033856 [Zingiber officinale]
MPYDYRFLEQRRCLPLGGGGVCSSSPSRALAVARGGRSPLLITGFGSRRSSDAFSPDLGLFKIILRPSIWFQHHVFFVNNPNPINNPFRSTFRPSLAAANARLSPLILPAVGGGAASLDLPLFLVHDDGSKDRLTDDASVFSLHLLGASLLSLFTRALNCSCRRQYIRTDWRRRIMFKNKIPILAKSSRSLLFQVRLYSPSFLAYSLRLPLRNPGSLHETFAHNALSTPLCLRWLSTATQRNDFPPDHYAHQESVSEPHYNSRSSFRSGMYQGPDGYRSGEAGGTPTYSHDQLNCHRSGIHEEFSSNSNGCDTSSPAHVSSTGKEWRNKHEFSVNSDRYNQGYSRPGGHSTSAFTNQHYHSPQTSWHYQNNTAEFHQNPSIHGVDVRQEGILHHSNVVPGHITNVESYGNGKEWHRREGSYQDPSGHYGERYPERFGTYSSFGNEKYGHNPGNVQHDPNSNCLDNRAGTWAHNPSIHGGDAQQEGFSNSSNVVRGHNTIANGESYGNWKECHRREELYQDPSGHYGERYPKPSGTYPRFGNEKYGHNPGNVQHDPNPNCLDNTAGTFPNNQKGTYTDREGNIHQRSHGFLKEMPTDILYDHAGYQRENPPVVHQNSAFSGSSAGQNTSESSIGSAEIGYSSRYKGTIDELDELCKEKKMEEAMEVLAMLEKNGFMVDLPRYLNLMVACDDDKFIEEARKLHSHILQRFENVEVRVNNKILDMYFKCSSTSDAFQLFDNMPHRNLTSWETMIMGLANNGYGEDAIEMFTGFKQKELAPDGGLFVSIFYVCGCLGAIEEGLLHFASMEKDFGIAPGMEHYLGIVDMLGRAGYLEEALEFIHQMPCEPSIDIWETLMTLSRLNGNLELGDLCAKVVEHLDASRLNEQSKKGLLLVKDSDLAKEKEKKKGLQLKSRIREYRAGDRSHPENDKLYAQLRCLQQQMKEAGYVPDTRFVLHDVDQESKEDALLAHSERLALSYALMTSSVRSDIKIMKNLRVCGDCHNALKIISKLVGRLIIARDAKRFHHFENGVCSCKDYW